MHKFITNCPYCGSSEALTMTDEAIDMPVEDTITNYYECGMCETSFGVFLDINNEDR